MKKSDLRTGMIVETVNGSLGMVLLGTKNGDIISGTTWFPLKDYSDEILFDGDKEYASFKAIYQPNGNSDYLVDGKINKIGCDCVWRRTDGKEMTLEEIQQALGYKIKVVESR